MNDFDTVAARRNPPGRVPSSSTPDPAFDQYLRFFAAHTERFAAVCPGARAADAPRQRRAAHYRIAPSLGRGWADMHAFENGLVVGRIQARFGQSADEVCESFPDNVRLGVTVQGRSRSLVCGGRQLVAGVGDIVVRHGDPGPLRSRMEGPGGLACVCVDVPRAMLEELRADGIGLSSLGRPGSCRVLRPGPLEAGRIGVLGARMLGLAAGESPLARIELESLGLDLLLKLLSACASAGAGDVLAPPGPQAAAVARALEIVHAEWNQPLTIAALARRAGINECYLKTLFRQKTGQTIAAYLRGLRMRHAREMLASGRYSVQQVAWHCGYVHAGKFAQAFRAIHGVAPSQLG